MAHVFAPVVNDPQRNSAGIITTSIPTDDSEVRNELRKLGQPITLFGEGKPERRARLEKLVREQKHTNFGFAEIDSTTDTNQAPSDFSEEDEEEFYTPGSEDLLAARKDLLEFSVKRASERVAQQRSAASNYDFVKVLKHRRNIAAQLSRYELVSTYTARGNTRALGCVRLNNRSSIVACGSWDGGIYFFTVDRGSEYQQTTRSAPGFHSEKSTLSWNPKEEHVLVSGGAEGTVNIWNVDAATGESLMPQATIRNAHGNRIASVAMHPNGVFFCTASFDQTWKLWDVQRPQHELLEQEGHSKEVFSCSFHPDGGLVGTGGLDAIARVWDLRSGRSILTLEGHIKGIYSMDFSPNGYHLATGSGDNSVKVWDLRKTSGQALFSIPAHSKIVSDVRFLQSSNRASRLAQEVTDADDGHPETLSVAGTYLASASYDGTVKLWSSDNWVGITTLVGHTDKVMGCDISANGDSIVSCGWDRTVRVWGPQE